MLVKMGKISEQDILYELQETLIDNAKCETSPIHPANHGESRTPGSRS